MDHSKHTSLAFSELSPEVLAGAPVYDHDDHQIATVADMHGEGASSGIVVSMDDKQVTVPASEIDFMRDEAGQVHGVIGWTKAQLAAMPADADT